MILVTGGSGLLGNALIKNLLLQGKKVIAIYNNTPLEDFGTTDLRTMQCDLLDVVTLQEIMEGVTQIYHCAGLVSFRRKDVQRLYQVNVEATANLVNAALQAGVKKMVHVSSVAAMGRIRQQEPIHEKMWWTPETSNSKYGETKYLGEMEVWRGIAEGLEAVVVNPSIILGPGDWNDGSTAIFKSAYNEFPWYTDGVTGFVGVNDVVRCMVSLMDMNVTAERFIISAHNESYRNVFNGIADAFTKKRPHKEVTEFLSRWVCQFEWIKSKVTGKEPLVTRETALTAMAKVYFDNRKLFQFIPSFKYEPLAQTITETCNALQQKLNRE